MRLYDIAADFRRLSDLLEDESTPEEMRQTIMDTLESLDGDFEDKAEGIAALIAENRATINAIESEIDRLTAKADRLENQNDSLKRYLKMEMDFTGKRKLNAGIWKISIAKNGGKAPIVWKRTGRAGSRLAPGEVRQENRVNQHGSRPGDARGRRIPQLRRARRTRRITQDQIINTNQYKGDF